MDPTNWGSLIALATSPVASLVLAFFVWKQSVDFRELKKALYDNGFVTKDDLEEAWKRANELHKRQDEHMERLEKDVVRLETNDRDIYGQINRMRERQ